MRAKIFDMVADGPARPGTPGTPGTPVPPARRAAVWIGTLAGMFLGGVFFFATWGLPPLRLGKVADPEAFAQVVHIEGLDFVLSPFSTAVLALGLEAAIAFFLLLGVRRLWVLVPTALLVVFFMYLNGKAYLGWVNGEAVEEMSCGCFGNLMNRTPKEAFWQDVFLLVPPLLLAFLGRPRHLSPVPVVRIALAGLLTIGTVVFAASAPDLPLSDLVTRLRPGVSVSGLCVGDPNDPPNHYCLADPALASWLTEGEHIVVLADLDDPDFADEVGDRIDEFAEFESDPTAPRILVVFAGLAEDQYEFALKSRAPPFDYVAVPEALIRPLYRRLPRTFVVRDGVVVKTYEGLPPLSKLVLNNEP